MSPGKIGEVKSGAPGCCSEDTVKACIPKMAQTLPGEFAYIASMQAKKEGRVPRPLADDHSPQAPAAEVVPGLVAGGRSA